MGLLQADLDAAEVESVGGLEQSQKVSLHRLEAEIEIALDEGCCWGEEGRGPSRPLRTGPNLGHEPSAKPAQLAQQIGELPKPTCQLRVGGKPEVR